MAGFLNKLGGAIGGLAKGAVTSAFPAAGAALNLLKSAKTPTTTKAGTTPSTQITQKSASNAQRGIQNSGGSGGSSWFKKQWDWLMKQKTDNPVLFWAIVILAPLLLLLIIWLVIKLIKRMRNKKSYSYTRSAKRGAAAPQASRTKRSGKRSMSAAQKAALAKGRAALARKRGK